MKFEKRTVKLHGSRTIYILIPESGCDSIIATDDRLGSYYTFGNSTGYLLLTELFSVAAKLNQDEFIYVPLNFAYMDGAKTYFTGMDFHYTGIVLINYNRLQISAKDLKAALGIKIYVSDKTERRIHLPAEYIEHWKTRRRLTVKTHGKVLIISTNGNSFLDMAHSCDSLTVYNDDAKYNHYPAHMHHDMDENTAKSLGITFYYCQCPPQEVSI